MEKKLTVKEYLLKTILLCVATLIAAFGVVLLIRVQMGSDPISVWIEGLERFFHIPLHRASLYNNVVTLGIASLLAFKNINIGTLISSVGFPYAISLIEPLVQTILGNYSSTTARVILTFVGVIIVAFGGGFTVSLRLGFGASDCILFKVSDKTKVPYRYLKMGTDALYAGIGFTIGGVLGFGTVVSMLATGPLIEIFARFYNNTVLKFFHIQDERNEFGKVKKDDSEVEITKEKALLGEPESVE